MSWQYKGIDSLKVKANSSMTQNQEDDEVRDGWYVTKLTACAAKLHVTPEKKMEEENNPKSGHTFIGRDALVTSFRHLLLANFGHRP